MSGAPHAERLSALDAGFLVAESPRTPMHIGALMTVEKAHFVDAAGRVRLDGIRGYVSDRLHLVPRMRQVLRSVPFSLGRPVWVDDPDFEIEHHVRLLEVPAPGDEAALLALVEELCMPLLDRNRPLWEWWVIDGLDDSGVPGGRLAVFEKVHHSIVDGVGGVQVLAAFTDLAVDMTVATQPWHPRPAPSGARLVGSAALDGARAPWRAAGFAIDAVRAGGRSGIGRAVGALGALGGMLTLEARAPTLSLNRPVGRRRRLGTLTLDLDETKTIAHSHHTKVNDVILTVTTGGLRALLAARGEPLTGQHVHVLVPEDVRDPERHPRLGNHITGFFAALPLDRADPEDALREITAVMRRERRDRSDDRAADLLSVADHAPYAVIRNLRPIIDAQPWVNTIVTNVPGPREHLWVDGAQVLSIAPLVPLSGNITVAVAALSYGDDITLMVNACRDACPDLGVMIEGMRSTAAELSRRSAGRRSVSRRRGARPRRG